MHRRRTPRPAANRFRRLRLESLEPRSLLALLPNVGTATDIVFNLPAAPSTVIFEDDGIAGNGISQLRSANGTFDTTTFENPGGSLTVLSGNAVDTIRVNALPDFTAGLSIGASGSEFSTITFASALTLAANKNLSANAATSILITTPAARLAVSGIGSVTLTSARSITLDNSSRIDTVNGDITIAANQQAIPTTGNFAGITIDQAWVQTSGSGKINLLGRGGDDLTTSQHYGVWIKNWATVESLARPSAGSISVVGTGGKASDDSAGVLIDDADVLSGLSNITITGAATAGSGSLQDGVRLTFGTSVKVFSGSFQLTVTGTPGVPADGSVGVGVRSTNGIVQGPQVVIASDRVAITPGTIAAAGANGAVSLRPLTAGTRIDLGSTTDTAANTLELSNTELSAVGAANLNIGDGNSGTITISAAVSLPGKNLRLTTAAGITGSGAIANGSATATTVTIDQAGDSSYGGLLGGPAAGTANDKNLAFTKLGAGTLTLTGTNTYTGATSVDSGALLVNGTIVGNVIVNKGATLGGTGTASSNSGTGVTVNSGGHLVPGAGGPDVLRARSTSLASGSIFESLIKGASLGTQYSQLVTTSGISLNGATLQVTLGFTPGAGRTFVILKNSTVIGTFDGLPEGQVFTVTTGPFAATFQITYRGATGRDVVLTVIDPTNPILRFPASAGSWEVKRKDANVEITANGTVIYSQPFAALTGLTINPEDPDQTLTLDLSGGNVIPSGGLSYTYTSIFNTPRSRLRIVGGDQGVVSNSYTNARDGSIVMSNYGTVTYKGLELLFNSGTASDLAFNLPTGPNTVTLSDDGDAPRNGLSYLYATTIVPTYFGNATGSLTINRGNPKDTLVVNDLPDFDAGLSVGLTTAPFAAITFSGIVILDVNQRVSADAATIAVLGPLTTSGGNIELAATGDLTIDAGLSTHGGHLKLSADADGDGVGTLTTKDDFFTQSRLDSPTGVNFGQFGASVATSGDGNTLIVGAPSEEPGGNVRGGTATIFVRSGDTWIVQQQLANPNGHSGDHFGGAVALSADGNTALVSAYDENVGSNTAQGTATVFVRSDGVWTAQQKFTMSGGGALYRFGDRLALSGDGNTAVFGVDSAANSRGSAIVFTRSGVVWTERQQLAAADGLADDRLGISVAVSGDGNTILAGAYLDDVGANANQGSAYVFERSGGVWIQQQKLTASNGAASDWFGWSVALSSDGNTALIGANEGHVSTDPDRGFVSAFTRTAGVWREQQQLTAASPTAADRFGSDVALSGDGITAVVTAEKHPATVFIRTSGVWIRQLQIPAAGYRAALNRDGDVLIVGNSREWVGNDTQNSEIGRAYVLTHSRTLAINGSITVSAAEIEMGGPLFTSGSASLAGSQAGRPVNVGSKAVGNLGLTDAELDLITADSLQIGDADDGPITVSANITRAAATNITLISGGAIRFAGGAISTGGGDLSLVPGDSTSVSFATGGLDVNVGDSGVLSLASGSNFAIDINGTAVDTEYEQLQIVGKVELSGVNLALSGGYLPSVGESFTIIDCADTNAVVGTFNNLPEGKIFRVLRGGLNAAFAITYRGGDGNDVTLTAVDPTPTFVPGGDVIATDESGPQIIAGWATAISPEPLGGASQQLHFVVTGNTNPGLFAAAPAIDTSGTLTFAPLPNSSGLAKITVVLVDDGGTASGGSDTSLPQTFTIRIDKAHVWHNAVEAGDVNADAFVVAGDALAIINYINAHGAGPVPTAGGSGALYYDVDADGFVCARDALVVINAINEQKSAFSLADEQQPELPPEGSCELSALVVLLADDVATATGKRRCKAD